MKDDDEQTRAAELRRAQSAQRKWSKEARLLDYKDFAEFMKDDAAGEQFCQVMEQKGFIVSNRTQGDRWV